MIAKGRDFCIEPSDGQKSAQLDPRISNLAKDLRAEAALACLPPALDRMNALLGEAPVDLKGLAEAVKVAPDLAAEAVKFCNSSLFALPQPVATLEQAVLLMDADIVRILLLTCWLTGHTRASAPARENRLFWTHSLLVAQLSRHIAEWAGYAHAEWAFLAGLFHDIGMLPFLLISGRGGVEGNESSIAMDAVEPQRRLFGIDHCELGLQMSSALHLPLPMTEVIAGHHQRGAALSELPLVSFAAAAEWIARAHASSLDAEAYAPPQEQMIRTSLAEYLPGLSPAARAGLIRTLEADLTCAEAGSKETKDFKVWDGPEKTAEARRNAGGAPL